MKYKRLALIFVIFLLFVLPAYAAVIGAGKFGEGIFGVGPAAAAAAAASSSNGGGGGTSSNPVTTSTVTTVSAGQEVKFNFDGDKSSIIDVAFTASTALNKIKMSATDMTKDQIKSAVSQSLEGNIYKYYEIKSENFDNSAVSGDAKITFDVENSWFTTINVKKDNVVMYRFVDGKWESLPTQVLSENDKHTRYLALSPGFSYFAVGEKLTQTVPPATGAATTEVAQPEKPSAPEVGKALSPLMTAVIVVVAILLLAAVVYFVFLRKKEK